MTIPFTIIFEKKTAGFSLLAVCPWRGSGSKDG